MRKERRCIAYILAVIMFISCFNVFCCRNVTYAAGKAKISQSKINLSIGESDKIKIKNITKGAKLSFKSSKKSVVSVSKKGVVKGLKAGKAKIKVTINDKGKKYKRTCTVIVNKPSFIDNTINMTMGDQSSIDINNKPIGKNVKYNWFSSDENVALVNNGTIKCVGPGTTKVTVNIFSGNKFDYSLSCDVTVSEGVRHSVFFVSNGGSVIENQSVIHGQRIVFPGMPVKDGCVFGGWFIDEGLTTTFDFSAPVVSDVVLYAKWIDLNSLGSSEQVAESNTENNTDLKEKCVVVFYSNGGNDIEYITVEKGASIKSPNNPDKDGYSFEGWYVDYDLTTAYDFNNPVNDNTMLYAKWNKVEKQQNENPQKEDNKESEHQTTYDKNANYLISFDLNGGEGTVDNQVIKGGDKVKVPEEPYKDNNAFSGWYKDKKCTELYDFTSRVSEDFVLYASWTKIIDNNNNSIPDIVEEGEYNTLDSDSDGVSDYYEFTRTNTNPYISDTDGDGHNDSESDTDEEGLNNSDEIKYGTNPLLPDTDGDGLTDYEEVSKYKTNPCVVDTDGDGLSDYDEVLIGLNPLSGMSNGKEADSERKFTKEVSKDNYDESLNDKNDMLPTVTLIDYCGAIDEHVSIHEDMSYYLVNEKYVKGKPININVDNNEFNAHLEFKFDNSRFSRELADMFVICHVDDDDFVPLDSVVDYENGIVSCDISENGVYFILELESFLKNLGFTRESLLCFDIEPKIIADATNLNSDMILTDEKLNRGEINYYKFSPKEDGFFSLYCNSEDHDVNVLLYDSNKNIIDQSNKGNAMFNYDLQKNKTYYMAVAFTYLDYEGQYTVGIKENDLYSNGVPVHYEDITADSKETAKITKKGGIKYYRFIPIETTNYLLESNSDKDTCAYVIDAEGNLIVENNDIGETDKNFAISVDLEEGKTYYFGVAFCEDTITGDIPINLSKRVLYKGAISINSFPDKENISYEVFAGYNTYFSFIPETSGKYTLQSMMEKDTYVTLLDTNGNELASDDNSGSNKNFKLSYSLSKGKTYYYKVACKSSSLLVTMIMSLTIENNMVTGLVNGNVIPIYIVGGSSTPFSNLTDINGLINTNKDNSIKGKYGEANIVFAIDTTGSMSSARDNVVKNINSFASTLSNKYNVNAKYALVDFKDIDEDEDGTTKVILNNENDWMNSEELKSAVQSLIISGGGDTPECDIDALEMARNLDYDRFSSNYIVLVTDATYKIANSFGISSMDEEIDKLIESSVCVSVVSSTSCQSSYKNLYEKTGGIFANINGDFGEELLKVADSIGEDAISSKWITLRGYKKVRLKGELSEGYDTDEDGIKDANEVGEYVEVNVNKFVKKYLKNSKIISDNANSDYIIGYYDYLSNPVLKDSDLDGIDDKKDSSPLIKGLAGGIVGELTIVSCVPDDNHDSGHSWLVYKSYVNDNIDISWTKGRRIYNSMHKGFTFSNTNSYELKPNSYFSIGVAASVKWKAINPFGGSFNKDTDYGGVYINNEFYNIGSDNQYYTGVSGYTKKITDVQLQALLSYSKNNNYYNLYTHNCAVYASEAYIKSVPDGASDTVKIERKVFPGGLRDIINKKIGVDTNYRQTMLDIYNNWK